MYICKHEGYCPTTETFDTVEAFLDMCRDCFGEAPEVRELPDGRVVDVTYCLILTRSQGD